MKCFNAVDAGANRHGERLALSRAWETTGEPLLTRRLCSVRFHNADITEFIQVLLRCLRRPVDHWASQEIENTIVLLGLEV